MSVFRNITFSPADGAWNPLAIQDGDEFIGCTFNDLVVFVTSTARAGSVRNCMLNRCVLRINGPEGVFVGCAFNPKIVTENPNFDAGGLLLGEPV